MESSTQMTPTPVSDKEALWMARQMVWGSVLPMVLKSAIELDLLEIIAKAGPGAFLSPKEVASHLPTTNPDAPVMLDRMFRLLASYSVLTCSLCTLPDGKLERLYGLGPVSKFLTKNQDGVSLSTECLLEQDKVLMECWYHLKDAVLEGGIPFNRAYGNTTLYEYLGADPRLNMIFNKGMFDVSTIKIKKILEKYDGFKGIKTLVDVGGGTGATLSMIVSKYPNMKGINFDLPHVIENAPTYTGVEHVVGDMFESIPKGDAVLLMSLCHSLSDEQCSMLFKKCHEALPDNGKVIVANSNLPDYPDTSFETRFKFILDCTMMTSFPGKERTKLEFEELAKGAGFQGFQVKCDVSGTTCIMEFLKSV